ncbi:jg15299 [Pararge aegeria aegeria]|uniref:Jg15299 protein n=1 Tax=Pararge aegeria aegeria TaxID=348720 RepID=A0A8S4RA37_9NEOP|nr:jg15299 [Pararge aegeria aegeria]
MPDTGYWHKRTPVGTGVHGRDIQYWHKVTSNSGGEQSSLYSPGRLIVMRSRLRNRFQPSVKALDITSLDLPIQDLTETKPRGVAISKIRGIKQEFDVQVTLEPSSQRGQLGTPGDSICSICKRPNEIHYAPLSLILGLVLYRTSREDTLAIDREPMDVGVAMCYGDFAPDINRGVLSPPESKAEVLTNALSPFLSII